MMRLLSGVAAATTGRIGRVGPVLPLTILSVASCGVWLLVLWWVGWVAEHPGLFFTVLFTVPLATVPFVASRRRIRDMAVPSPKKCRCHHLDEVGHGECPHCQEAYRIARRRKCDTTRESDMRFSAGDRVRQISAPTARLNPPPDKFDGATGTVRGIAFLAYGAFMVVVKWDDGRESALTVALARDVLVEIARPGDDGGR